MLKKNPGQKRVSYLFNDPKVKQILLASGSRSGKSFLICYYIVLLALKFPKSKHLIARKTFTSVKSTIWMGTLPDVISKCFPELKPYCKWDKTNFILNLPNESSIWVAGLDDKDKVDKILGHEFFTMFLNEVTDIVYDTYEVLMSRLAQQCFTESGKIGKNMVFLDCNPTSSQHWACQMFVHKKYPIEDKERKGTSLPNPEVFGYEKIHPWENTENQSAEYLNTLKAMSPSKRKRFLDGEFSDGSANALWTYDIIHRVNELPKFFRRIVVAVDPAVTSTDKSDETGIVVCAMDHSKRLYVLEDATGKYTPTDWAKKVNELYQKWKANIVVAEGNQGGDLVTTVLRSINNSLPVTKVHAKVGKVARAEPVAALYEQGLVVHYGIHTELETQMTEWEGKKGDPSPNNIDALVWGMAELMPEIGVNSTKIGGAGAAALRNGIM